HAPVLINNGGRIIFLTDAGFFEAFKRTKIIVIAIIKAKTVLAIIKNIKNHTLFLVFTLLIQCPVYRIHNMIFIKWFYDKILGSKFNRFYNNPLLTRCRTNYDFGIRIQFFYFF